MNFHRNRAVFIAIIAAIAIPLLTLSLLSGAKPGAVAVVDNSRSHDFSIFKTSSAAADSQSIRKEMLGTLTKVDLIDQSKSGQATITGTFCKECTGDLTVSLSRTSETSLDWIVTGTWTQVKTSYPVSGTITQDKESNNFSGTISVGKVSYAVTGAIEGPKAPATTGGWLTFSGVQSGKGGAGTINATAEIEVYKAIISGQIDTLAKDSPATLRATITKVKEGFYELSGTITMADGSILKTSGMIAYLCCITCQNCVTQYIFDSIVSFDPDGNARLVGFFEHQQ